jgi:hypothetical protein
MAAGKKMTVAQTIAFDGLSCLAKSLPALHRLRESRQETPMPVPANLVSREHRMPWHLA